jgi:biotin transport system ATP-binding protein
VIVLEGVTHRFGERIVLREVSVTLPERRVGIVGDNGSGKSTLARMLNGLVVPTTGRVVVDGLDTRRHGREVRRKVGFVFTDPDAQIVMPTVVEDVAFGLRRSGLPRSEVRARVHAALTTYGLEDHADHPAHLLSGGEKQLLALAAVLVTEPALLVCDEPTTLLDRRNARRVVALLHGLPQQVVLVTHHLDLLAGFERVLVLEDGRLVDDGPPDPVLAAYRDRVG